MGKTVLFIAAVLAASALINYPFLEPISRFFGVIPQWVICSTTAIAFALSLAALYEKGRGKES